MEVGPETGPHATDDNNGHFNRRRPGPEQRPRSEAICWGQGYQLKGEEPGYA